MISLTAPLANLNILLNPAMAQGYNENYSEDRKYTKYPTEENKYEWEGWGGESISNK